MPTLRSAVATAVPILALVAYGAFAIYGFYIEQKLVTLWGSNQPIPQEDRWNAALYPEEAAKWIARDRLWHRLRVVVWLGLIVVATATYFLIKP